MKKFSSLITNLFVLSPTTKLTNFSITTSALSNIVMDLQPSGKSSILIVGLNPAIQKRFVLTNEDKLIPGNVHRANAVQKGIGGKGQDVYIALTCLIRKQRQQSSKTSNYLKLSLAQFIGMGFEGEEFLRILRDVYRNDEESFLFERCTIRTKNPIRTCTTIISTDYSTELVEPSGHVEDEEINSLLSRIEEENGSHTLSGGDIGVRGICIMGSMPPGCPSCIYADILQRAVYSDSSAAKIEIDSKIEQKGSVQYLCLIDSVAGLEPLFEELKNMRCKSREGAQKIRAVLKINVPELSKLGDNASAALSSDPSKLHTTVESFLAKYRNAQEALDFIAVTDGKGSAHLVQLREMERNIVTPNNSGKNSDGIHHICKIDIPNLQEIYPEKARKLYPIGAGDAVAAGTLYAWIALSSGCIDARSNFEPIFRQSKMDTFLKAFMFGLACGSASCLQEQNSMLDVYDVEEIFTKMVEMSSRYKS